MGFVESAAVKTINTKQFLFVFAVEGDKVEMFEAFLWELVFVAGVVEIKRCAVILFFRSEGVDIILGFAFEEKGGFGGGAFLP